MIVKRSAGNGVPKAASASEEPFSEEGTECRATGRSSLLLPLGSVALLLLLISNAGGFFFLYNRLLVLESLRGSVEAPSSLRRGDRDNTLGEGESPISFQDFKDSIEDKARRRIEAELEYFEARLNQISLKFSNLVDAGDGGGRARSPPFDVNPPEGPPRTRTQRNTDHHIFQKTPKVTLKEDGPLDLKEDRKDSPRARRGPSRGKRGSSEPPYSDDNEGELSVQLQGQSSEPGSDQSWLQLTSYARIPYNAIQEFCSRTRDSCPPGPQGPIGIMGNRGLPGLKGDSGDRGLPGIQGPRGPPGLLGATGSPGLNGKKGDIGSSGIPGLDGRDGLPGEPGLDGIPGRNGLDGIPGVDGIPGFDGLPGTDGRNGTDGRPGDRGYKGDQGPIGPQGIAGARGRTGKNGTPGEAGKPGIQTWKVNGTDASEILIPPSIPGKTRKSKTIVVREKDNLRLRCQAAGFPTPAIEWSRDDGLAIATGQWKDGSLVSPTLNLTYIRRDHTGTYRCEAYNGIGSPDNKTFDVEVHFDPFVRVNQWKVGTFNGSSAVLECHVESFPVPVTYWEDRRGRILENATKHRIHFLQDEKFIWKSKMSLNITNINKEDFGDYHCVAKNELSTTRGLVKVHEIDPNRYVPSTGSVDGLTFGPDPPNYSELFNDLCPPPVDCPNCPEPSKRPESRGSLYCLRVQQFGNDTYPGFRNRTLDCELSAVGKAVYHRHTESPYGTWLRDPMPRDIKIETRYWTTSPDNPNVLVEFENKNRYRKNQEPTNHVLPKPFQGNSHIVYNGFFFYQEKGQKNIIKYDILTKTNSSLEVQGLSLNESNYLYDNSRDLIDLNTDENGLWAIYGLAGSNNTVVMKIDPWNFKVEYSWNISLSHRKFGEMFITCGVLYGIESSTKHDTKIRFALDLYKKNILDVDLSFTNPFGRTTLLGYNPKTKEIYSWDDGNQLTYPIKYIDIGYNQPPESSESKSKSKFADDQPDVEIGGY